VNGLLVSRGAGVVPRASGWTAVSRSSRAPSPFELRNASLALVALVLQTTDLDLLSRALDERFGETPLFEQDPVAIDLAPVAGDPTPMAYIKDRVQPNKKALYPQTTTIMYQQLKSKRCDAALYDAPILGAQKYQEPKAYGPIVGQIITNEQYGAAFQKGDPIRPTINKILKKLLADGTIGKLSTKWLTFDASKLPVFK